MNLVDANVLISAVDVGADRHAAARRWLDGALGGTATVLLPWVSLLAFVRLTTHPRVFARPLAVDVALSVVDGWLAVPTVVTPEPDARHATRLRELLTAAGGRGGNLVNDAHLAALAVQLHATVVTFDSDFTRFRGIRVLAPS